MPYALCGKLVTIEGWELINLISVLLIVRSRYYAELLPQAKQSSSAALLERSDPVASLAPEQLKGEEG